MAEEVKTTEVEAKEEVKVEPTVIEDTTPKAKAKTEPDADTQTQIQSLLTEVARLKRAVDKSSSEASEYKKKWKASLSEQEQASMEKAEAEAEREEKYKALLRENTINKLEKTYLGMGYTADEASRIAVAEADGDFEARISIMTEVQNRLAKAKEEEIYKSLPPMQVGVGDMDGEDIDPFLKGLLNK